MKFGEWTKTADQMPPEPKNVFVRDYYLAITENNLVIAVEYRKETISNKEIIRWKWMERICPWKIVAYMPFPQAYKDEKEVK